MNLQTPNDRANGSSAGFNGLHPDLKSFLDAGDLSNLAVDNFFAGLSSPLAEPGALTFLWRGDAVGVQLLRWIHADLDEMNFMRVTDSDLWHLRIPARDGGRFEYKLKIIWHGGEEWIHDPQNSHRAGDSFGENSVAMSYGYSRPEWSIDRGAPRGTVETLDVDSVIFKEVRNEKVYVPAEYDAARRHPLVVIHDGGDYDDYAGLTILLDNLIEAGDIPPLVAVLIQAGDRMSEYPKSRRHARYVVGEILPSMIERYAISDEPADRVLLGASLGAVASLATAFRFPGVFGGLILKSGSFVFDSAKLKQRPHRVFHSVARLVEAVRRAPALPATRAFVSSGELEGLFEENRALAELLQERGVEVLFRSTLDGHHWHNWRDQMRDALIWVLRPDRQQ